MIQIALKVQCAHKALMGNIVDKCNTMFVTKSSILLKHVYLVHLTFIRNEKIRKINFNN